MLTKQSTVVEGQFHKDNNHFVSRICNLRHYYIIASLTHISDLIHSKRVRHLWPLHLKRLF